MADSTPANAYTPEGVTSVASASSVADTVTHIEQALTAAEMTLFAVIDHSGEATQAGLSMQEARLLIFGNPKGGTPLMVASPLLALALPLKALVWQDAAGQVWVSYASPVWLAQRYHVPADLARNIAGMEPLIAAAIQW
ncbi:MAG: DUF302 domain-containing protein [Ktedonobacterales bacterium]